MPTCRAKDRTSYLHSSSSNFWPLENVLNAIDGIAYAVDLGGRICAVSPTADAAAATVDTAGRGFGLRHAMATLLETGAYRRKARELSELFTGSDGASKGADEIEALLSKQLKKAS